MSSLLLGTAVADITPSEPVELYGFAGRGGPWQTVLSPLSAQVFAFGRSAVLVCADLAWWGPDLADRVRREVADQHGIPADAVVLHASHTHSAPAPGLTFSPSIGAGDARYLDALTAAVVDAVGKARANPEPVTVAVGTGICPIGTNRRRLEPDGSVALAPNPHGPVDPEVTVVRFTASDGSPKAVLVHFACHPVINAERQVTPDFPGAMRTELRLVLGSDTVVGFLQGCCGDIDPALERNGRFVRGPADIDPFGTVLAKAAAGVLGRPMTDPGPVDVGIAVSTVPLPLRKPSRESLVALREDKGVRGEWSRTLLADPDRLVDRVLMRLTLLRIARDLAFICFAAEVTVPYAFALKQRYGPTLLALGYTGGMVGYLVTAEQLAEGGYEPDESYRYIYRPGPFDPRVEQIVHSAVDSLVAGPA